MVEHLDDRYWLLFGEEGVYLCRNDRIGHTDVSVCLNPHDPCRTREEAIGLYAKHTMEEE